MVKSVDELATRATALTCVGILATISGLTMTGVHFGLGDPLEGDTTEFSEQTEQSVDAMFADVVAKRDQIKELEFQSYQALQRGEMEEYSGLIDNMEHEVGNFEDSYETLLSMALTNKFFSEVAYKDLVKNIEAEDLPIELNPDMAYRFNVSADSAEYLNACRIDASDGVAPLTVNIGDASDVARCMDRAAEDHNQAVIMTPFAVTWVVVIASLMASTTNLGGNSPVQTMHKAYSNMYRRKKNKLGQN
tara:strand:+ start:146 stop:889 length:744 start_codon:yes stop_codon:yes gene_type:complete